MRPFLLPFVVLACLTIVAPVQAQESELARLIHNVRSADPAIAAIAIDDLAGRGEQAAVAIPALIRVLAGDQPELQWRAARTLGALGPLAEGAIPALRNGLKHDHPRVAAYSAYALGRIGEPAQTAAVDLVPLVTSQDPIVRRAARDALRRIGADRAVTLPLMAQALEEANPDDVVAALRTLAELGEDALPVLEAALQHPKAAYWACLMVADLGPQAKSTVPLVANVLNHRDPECRMQAAVALGEIGVAARSAEEAVVQALVEDEFAAVKAAAAYALVSMEAQSKEALAALTLARASDDPLVRVVSAWALIQLQPENEQLVRSSLEVLVEGLKSEDKKVRVTAARGLIDSKASRDVVGPPLAAALRTSEDELTRQLVEGLAGMGTQAVPAVVGLLEVPELRHLGTMILNRMGMEASQAVPALMGALRESRDDPQYRRELQFALGAIGAPAAVAVPELMVSLTSDDDEVRRSAIYALGKIGPAAQEATPALNRLLTAEDKFDRIGAAWSLLKIDLDNVEVTERALPLLTDALEHDRELIRKEAAQALGELGEEARSAIPALRQRLADPSVLVQDAAREALERIGQ